MDRSQILDYLVTWGMWFLFIIVYLEYLNFPGLPAGIIMPSIGLLCASGEFKIILVIFVSVIAGILGSLTLYAVGYFLGAPVIDVLVKKFQKMKKPIDKVNSYYSKYGNKGVLICRTIPVARTLVSLTSGIVKMRLISFTVFSLIGILIWNVAFIMSGYFIAKFFII